MTEGQPGDLLSAVLTLRPLAAGPAAPFYGREAQGLLLGALEQVDAALARDLHDSQGPKPITVSSLLGPKSQGLEPDRHYHLRLTAIDAGVTAALFQALRAGPLAPGAEVRLGEARLLVEGVTFNPEEHSWAASARYDALSAPWLMARRMPARRIRVHLASPTTFKRAGMHLPFPLPELAFGSLLDRWNAFSPIELPAELRRYAAECLAVSRYELSTRSLPMKAGAVRKGASGWIEYYALNPDRYWLALANLLAEFALFCGVGAGTTMGLGQARLKAERWPRRAAVEDSAAHPTGG